MCGTVSPIALPVDFLVLMHYREYLRCSNTGHLLPLAHPSSSIFIRDLPEDDHRLFAIQHAEPENVVVLYPSQV
jgi:DTW domain-containing protein YfiP